MSRDNDITENLTARLAAIQQHNGFETNIGDRVYRGKRKLDESCIPCAVIVESDDSVTSQQGRKANLRRRYQIEGHAVCDPDNPNDVALAVIRDLKRVIFDGTTIPGCQREVLYVNRIIAPREDGTAIVAAAIEIDVQLVEDLSSP